MMGPPSYRIKSPPKLSNSKQFEAYRKIYESNSMTRIALANNDNSIEGPRLKRYMTLAAVENKESSIIKESTESSLPSEIETLLRLQKKDGSWNDIHSIAAVIGIDIPSGITRNDSDSITALVLAYFRQQCGLFTALDKAYSAGLVLVGENKVRLAAETFIGVPYAVNQRMVHSVSRKKLILSEPNIQEDTHPQISEAASSLESYNTRPSQPSLHEASESSKLAIISLLGELDIVLNHVKTSLNAAEMKYAAAVCHTERAGCFDELIVCLGNGCEAVAGLSGWRGTGVVSLRGVVLRLLVALHDECNQPQGEALLRLRWGSLGVLDYVLHCTDFLGQSSQLKEFFGNNFPFELNPLMLSQRTQQVEETILHFFPSIKEALCPSGYRSVRNYSILKDLVYSQLSVARKSDWPEVPQLHADGFLQILKAIKVLTR